MEQLSENPVKGSLLCHREDTDDQGSRWVTTKLSRNGLSKSALCFNYKEVSVRLKLGVMD